MPTLAPELEKPAGGVIEQQPQQPSLESRLENPGDSETIKRDEKELAGFIKPVETDMPDDVVDDKTGDTLLQTSGIKSVADLSLPENELKPNKWYHFHKHIGYAIAWIVEMILRREKKEARE